MSNTLKTYQSQRYKVNDTFMERLEKSIEKKYFKDYLIKKHDINERTGQPYYQPNMTLSKHSYEILFHKSL